MKETESRLSEEALRIAKENSELPRFVYLTFRGYFHGSSFLAMLSHFQRFRYIKYQLVNLRKKSILVEY